MKISFARPFGSALFVLQGLALAGPVRADWSLRGRILDEKRLPLEGAIIHFKGPQGIRRTSSDIRGDYHIEGLVLGEFTISISADGYSTQAFSCTQPFEADGHMDIRMGNGENIIVRIPVCGGMIDTHSSASVTHLPQWVMEMER